MGDLILTVKLNKSYNTPFQASFPLAPVDYVLMEQVFTNLISNSVKYAPPETDVTIRARLQGTQTALVQVINQGPHVPEESLERIFDKFYRVTAADKITGTGLGLSICKGIIEAHGGRIWAENREDASGRVLGARFAVEFPEASPEPRQGAAKQAGR